MATHAPNRIEVQEEPSHVRYWVLVFAVALAVFSYIDRVALSRAAGTISKELNLSKTQMGLVFSAFAWAYAAFEVPSGYLGDRLGPRRVLMRIVIWWSFFTAATGWAFNFVSLFFTQLLFGAGEAGCFPNITKALSTWLPQEERVRAQGIIWLSARWGGAFTPMLVVFLFRYVSWRYAFAIFGCIGVVWAFFFYRWYRDNPRDNPKVNEGEMRLIAGASKSAGGHGNVPWAKFARSPQVWLLCLQYFCLSFGWYFYITWLPTFLDEHLKLDITKSALLNTLPLFLGGLGSLFCGFIAAPLTRLTGSLRLSRRILACTGFFGAGTLLLLSTRLHDPVSAMLAIGFSSFCNDLVMPTSWGTAMDVGGKYAGTLSGTMNMLGNFGGACYGPVAGFILSQTHNNWDMPIYLSAAVYYVGIFLWLLIDPITPIEPPDAHPVPA